MRCKVFYPTPKQRAATARYATLLNWGAKHTTGEYLTFLCSDDYYMPDRLERMVAVLDARASVCYGAQRLIGDTEGIRHTRGELAKASNVVDLNSVMLTRAVFDAVDGFDDGPELWRTADARLWDKLTDAGYLFVPVPGGPTDVKRYRQQSVDARVIRGENPWLPSPS
jgi:glycosyltransferase involved in cell wall biosynthesis